MRKIQASQAKAHLLELPEAAPQQQEVERAIEGIQSLRKKVGKMSLKDILSARDEGRRY